MPLPPVKVPTTCASANPSADGRKLASPFASETPAVPGGCAKITGFGYHGSPLISIGVPHWQTISLNNTFTPSTGFGGDEKSVARTTTADNASPDSAT